METPMKIQQTTAKNAHGPSAAPPSAMTTSATAMILATRIGTRPDAMGRLHFTL